jgi:hypothetical protein
LEFQNDIWIVSNTKLGQNKIALHVFFAIVFPERHSPHDYCQRFPILSVSASFAGAGVDEHSPRQSAQLFQNGE